MLGPYSIKDFDTPPFFRIESSNFTESTDYSFDDENFVWLQYTGLTDKNGKEIYEGDILDGGFLAGAVQWDNLRAKYVVQLTSEGWHDLPIIAEMKEVISNIYENPKLLK